MVFEVTATGFGSGDMFLHWGVGKQSLGADGDGWGRMRSDGAAIRVKIDDSRF